MKYNQLTTLSLSLLLTIAAGTADASSSRCQKAVKCADKKAQKKYYAAAADMYEHILAKPCSKDSTWRDSMNSVKVRLADCYMKMGNTIKAEANYADVVKAGKADANTKFNYGRALQANDKYGDAKDQFDAVADDASLIKKMPKGFSEESEKAMKAGHKNGFSIEREPFNTTASEYATAYYKTGLAFTSNRAERGISSNRIMWNKEQFTDIYTVAQDGKGDLNMIDKLPAPINSKLNDGAATFNAAYNEIFFTRNNKKAKKHDQLQIFTSTYNGTEWNTPKLLNFVMEGASYAHPSLSPDGNTLYFSSDVSGSGFGGMDLYSAHRNGSVWETPVNLGPGINTAGNETFPFVAADSSLYFTSDGWPGYGGMDIFHAKMEGGKFGKVRNMGADFNSQKDDLALIVDTKNRTGYISSNRDGDDDIYSFKLPVPKKDEEKKIAEPKKSMLLTDKETGLPIANARVDITDPRNPTAGAFYYTNDSGIFYYDKKIAPEDDIKIIKDKYQTTTLRGTDITDTKGYKINMQSDKEIVQEADQYSTVLYYDVNKSHLINRSIDSLRQAVKLMNNPKNVVYVTGFADMRGGDTYNYGLSLRRVKEVVDYLTSQGVDQLKIRSAYFGAVKLSKECMKKAKCIEETNRQNRRVEIRVGKAEE